MPIPLAWTFLSMAESRGDRNGGQKGGRRERFVTKPDEPETHDSTGEYSRKVPAERLPGSEDTRWDPEIVRISRT